MDKYAKPDGRILRGRRDDRPASAFEGPALQGATNISWPARVAHRETAYQPRAFREIYKFIAARADRISNLRREKGGAGRQLKGGLRDGHTGRRQKPTAGGGGRRRVGDLSRPLPDGRRSIKWRIQHLADPADVTAGGPAQVDPIL